MIKTLNVSLGQIGVAQLDPPGIAVPDVAPGVYATGYYTDEATGVQYYYNANLNQWYYYAAGLYYPLGISWKPSPSPMIDIAAGETLRFLLDFYFMGPKQLTQTFKAFIGNNSKSGGFGEWDNFWGKNDITVPASDTPVHYTDKYVDLLIPSGHAGEDGAAYCKKDQFFIEEGKDSTPYYYDVCHIVPAEGEFTEMAISKFEKVE